METKTTAPPWQRWEYLAITGFFLLACAFFASFFLDGVPHRHDRYVPLMRIQAIYENLTQGTFPIYWFSGFDGGLGSPYPSFYAMLFYYHSAVLMLLGVPLIAGFKATIVLSFVYSGVGMYFLVRRLGTRWGALLAAALYMLAPYHLVVGFVRGAYSELFAFVWLPVLLNATLKLAERSTGPRLAVLALSIAALILSHNISAMISLPFLGLLSVGMVFDASAERRGTLIGYLAGAWALGLALACFFWLPAAVHMDDTKIRSYAMMFHYYDHFVPVGDLFTSARSFILSKEIGWIHLALLCPFLVWLVGNWHRRQALVLLLALSLVAATFMTLAPSRIIYQLVQPLQFVQFPWRFLVLSSFFASVCAGLGSQFFRTQWQCAAVTIATILGLVTVHAPLIRPAVGTLTGLAAEDFKLEVWGTQDYRPRWSSAPFWFSEQPPPWIGHSSFSNPPRVIAGVATIESYAQNRDNLWRFVYAAKSAAIVEMPQFYHPGWRAELYSTGEQLGLMPLSKIGTLGIALPAGSGQVEVRFVPSRTQRLSAAISLGALLVVLLVFARSFARRSSLHS